MKSSRYIRCRGFCGPKTVLRRFIASLHELRECFTLWYNVEAKPSNNIGSPFNAFSSDTPAQSLYMRIASIKAFTSESSDPLNREKQLEKLRVYVCTIGPDLLAIVNFDKNASHCSFAKTIFSCIFDACGICSSLS